MSFYSKEELNKLGFKFLGNNVLLSRKASVYSPDKISIGDNVRIDDFCILSGEIAIGNHIHIAAYSALYGAAGIILEDFSCISSRVTIYSISDDYSGMSLVSPVIPEEYKKVIRSKVVIKKHAIIGASTVVLPGVVIAQGTAIGASSLVNINTLPWKIYVGIPLRILKDRKTEILELERKFLESGGGCLNQSEEINKKIKSSYSGEYDYFNLEFLILYINNLFCNDTIKSKIYRFLPSGQ